MTTQSHVDPRIRSHRHGERLIVDLLQQCANWEDGRVVFIVRRLGLQKIFAAKSEKGVVVIGYVKHRRGDVDHIRDLQRRSQDDGTVVMSSNGMSGGWHGPIPVTREDREARRARAEQAGRDMVGAVNSFVHAVVSGDLQKLF